MTTIQLDTSGSVGPFTTSGPAPAYYLQWCALTPFVQGFIEAMFSGDVDVPRGPRILGLIAAFSDLAPETLARIIGDCERYQQAHAGPGGLDDIDPRKAGARYWHARNKRESNCYAPLTPYLGDDGCVYLNGAG